MSVRLPRARRGTAAGGSRVGQPAPRPLGHSAGTPLHWAAAMGHEEAARLLLENGADPNILAGNGLNASRCRRRERRRRRRGAARGARRRRGRRRTRSRPPLARRSSHSRRSPATSSMPIGRVSPRRCRPSRTSSSRRSRWAEMRTKLPQRLGKPADAEIYPRRHAAASSRTCADSPAGSSSPKACCGRPAARRPGTCRSIASTRRTTRCRCATRSTTRTGTRSSP